MSEPLRLAYVSPLPPVRSGISDYSVDLLTSLERFFAQTESGFEVSVVRVPGQEVDASLVERLRPVEAGTLESWAQEGDGTLPWYQMGNNPYHSQIGEMARRMPGVVTLHDIWLHHLLIEETLAQGRVGAYVERLVEEHGWLGGAVALPPRWSGYSQAAVFAFPAHRTLLEAQRGVLVHSRWAAEFLQEEGVRVPVAVVPMPMPAPALSDSLTTRSLELRQRLGIDADALLLGSFGFQTPIKRTTSVVRALAEQGLEGVHLLVAGEVSPAVDLAEVVRSCGVQGRVHEVGFLSEEEFQVAIEASDLCVNLRYPTAGETSASLLRTFARGRGAIVSDYAQFADFDESVVVKVPVADAPEEAQSLAAVLRPLVADRAVALSLGASARRLVETQHDPLASAKAMIEAIRGFPTTRPAAAEHREPPPTSRTWGELPSALEVRGAADWAPGERRELEIELRNRGFATFLPAEAGPGGVALAVELVSSGRDLNEAEPWLPLPRRVEPGESFVFRLKLRRPLGATVLRVEPQVVGGEGFEALGGAFWEASV